MSWKKHLVAVPQGAKLQAAIERLHRDMENQAPHGAGSKFLSYLPEVYAGQPNRLERYQQYDNMDRDPEVNAALDTIADFGTLGEEHKDTPFKIRYYGEPTDAESEILVEALNKWCKLNEFKRRIWRIFRSTIMYGDQFFVRDPETFIWYWANHEKIESITVNEAEGKEPQLYNVYDLDLNLKALAATLPTKNPNRGMSGWAGGGTPGTAKNPGPVAPPSSPLTGGSPTMNAETKSIDAQHVIHLSLSEGIDANWPFGNSVLEAVFKPFKQKELLEDSIIIYRVQRAPERRVFYIDVGNAPTHKAMEFVNRIKNEIHQRRIPSQTGGGTNIMDAAYNPLCLSLDTTVPLLDGRTLSLNELITEYKEGKENWTYSCDPITGKIVPGNITWAGVTRKNAQVIKLHLDDGSTVTVTPDHKIPVLGKGFVEAQNLSENDSLISFKSREQSLVSSDNKRTYTQVYDHELNEWVYVHRMVGNFFRHINKHQEFTYLEENTDSHKSVVHHKDFNRYNNDPRNLQWMNHQDHIRYHQDTNMWQYLTDEEAERISNKISETNKKNWIQYRDSWISNIRSAQKRSIWLRKHDEQVKKNYKENMGKSRRKFLENNPSFVTKVLLPNLSTWQENIPNQEKVYTFEQLRAIYDLAKKHNFKLKFMLRDIESHKNILSEIRKVNVKDPKKQCRIQTDNLTQTVVYNTIKHFGYRNWMDFKRKKEEFNHRVVKIEWLTEKQDTGTITIDSQERWHNYHTFPVNNSIYVKNSIIEDYFFPQTAEGRGSKVETLPGGENLGEIDDLKYFNNKLLRGLRVPPSYLPFGPDDSSAVTYTDGRVGTAYMQEFRFAKYVKRLQNLINHVFDKEFKLFLRHRGIQIDSGLFELELHEPQNFSKYRQLEIDAAQINTFQPLAEVKYFSKRFLMQRFLNLTPDEIAENERMWKEENPRKAKAIGSQEVGSATGPGGLGDVGVRPGSEDDLGGEDLGEMPDEGFEGEESPISGAEGGGPDETAGDLEI